MELSREELLARIQSGELDDDRYEELVRIWDLGGLAAPPQRSGLQRPSAEDIIRRAEERAPELNPAVSPPSWKRTGWTARVAAAVMLICVGFGAGAYAQSRDGGSVHSLQVQEFTTGEGEMVTVALSDGSSARLGPRSHLRLVPGHDVRELWLEGTAFFAVAADSSRPFTVATGSGTAVALGTRFDVRVADGTLRLIVVDGRVALTAGTERVEVGAGEMSQAAPGEPLRVVAVPDVYPLLEWMGRALVFQATPLSRVAEELEARYGVDVQVDAAIADRTITASFPEGELDQVVEVVCRVADVRCEVSGSFVVIGTPR